MLSVLFLGLFLLIHFSPHPGLYFLASLSTLWFFGGCQTFEFYFVGGCFFFFYLMSDLIYFLLLEHLILDWTQKWKLPERTAPSLGNMFLPFFFGFLQSKV